MKSNNAKRTAAEQMARAESARLVEILDGFIASKNLAGLVHELHELQFSLNSR